MKTNKIPAIKDDAVNVIIETPKGSQNKFDFNPGYRLFVLKKTLPMGMVFPFDFGFIPNTKGGDGDPLDVLVIMDQPAYPGCLVTCRLLGVLEAEQVEKDGKPERNDRIIAIAQSSVLHAGIVQISDLNEDMVKQVEAFFINYNEQEGKQFKPRAWRDAAAALKMIKKHLES